MFEAYYNAALAAWRQLYGYALINKLADGSPMPTRMQAAVLAHYPVVLSLVLQGRRAPATDLRTHYRIASRIGEQLQFLDSIAGAFAELSIASTLTTPPWTQYRRAIASLRATNPDLANILPDPNTIDWTFGLGAAGALAVGAVVILAATGGLK